MGGEYLKAFDPGLVYLTVLDGLIYSSGNSNAFCILGEPKEEDDHNLVNGPQVL